MFSDTSDQKFTKDFMLSLGLHTAVLLVAFTAGEFISGMFKVEGIEVIQSSVRVDVVGMPKFTVQELKKMQAQPIVEAPSEVAKGSKAETKTEAEDVIKKDDLVIQEATKKKKTSFLNMINDYSAKKVAPKAEVKGEDKAVGNKNLESLILEGNRISKGSALVGDYSDEENSEFSAYVQSIPGVIRPFWKLPSYLMDQNLRCRIKIFLSPVGQLLKVEISESSGSDEFDKRAEKAVREAAPFPRPAPAVGTRLTNSGIILGFPL